MAISGVFVLCSSGMVEGGLLYRGSLVTQDEEGDLICTAESLFASVIHSPEDPNLYIKGKVVSFVSSVPEESIFTCFRRLQDAAGSDQPPKDTKAIYCAQGMEAVLRERILLETLSEGERFSIKEVFCAAASCGK